jgi:hypothetical protein
MEKEPRFQEHPSASEPAGRGGFQETRKPYLPPLIERLPFTQVVQGRGSTGLDLRRQRR